MAIRKIILSGLILGMAATASIVDAQQNAPVSAAVYDSAREVTLVGTVVSYQSAVDKPPLGAHVVLNTSAGNVDVHLGDARFLAANKFQIQSGDSIRIIGENVSYAGGTQFLARVIQKGTQALVLRSVRGIPLSYAAPHKSAAPAPQGGAQ
jgi:hypothetical protein